MASAIATSFPSYPGLGPLVVKPSADWVFKAHTTKIAITTMQPSKYALQAHKLSGSYCGGKCRPSKLSVQETVEGNLLVSLKPGDKDFSKKTLDLYYDDQLLVALAFGSKTHKTYGETLAALQTAGCSQAVSSDQPAGAESRLTLRDLALPATSLAVPPRANKGSKSKKSKASTDAWGRGFTEETLSSYAATVRAAASASSTPTVPLQIDLKASIPNGPSTATSVSSSSSPRIGASINAEDYSQMSQRPTSIDTCSSPFSGNSIVETDLSAPSTPSTQASIAELENVQTQALTDASTEVAMDKIIPSSPSTPISPQSSSSTPRSSIGSDAAISHRNAVAADPMPGHSSPSTSAEPLSESVLEVMPPTAIADDAFSEEPKEMAVTQSLGPLAETPSAALSTIPQMAASPALAPMRTSTATSLQAPIGELSSQAAVEPAEDVSPQLEEHREDTSRFWTASAWLAYTAKLVYSTAGVCAGILEGCKLAAGGAL